MDNLEAAIQNEDESILTSSMTGMEMFYPIIAAYEEGHTEYRARLFDYNDFDRNTLVKILFEQFCTENGIQIQKKIRFTADMYIYRIILDSLEKYQLIAKFEGLYSIEKTSLFRIALDSLSELTGGKGVTFAIGTPISNSMTELYTNMCYLQYDTLQKLGLGHFDSWAASFGETQTAN